MINLDNLNSKQLEAVTSMKNTMVVASAGTTVLIIIVR